MNLTELLGIPRRPRFFDRLGVFIVKPVSREVRIGRYVDLDLFEFALVGESETFWLAVSPRFDERIDEAILKNVWLFLHISERNVWGKQRTVLNAVLKSAEEFQALMEKL